MCRDAISAPPAATSTRIVDANRHPLPRGSFVSIRGQIETMRSVLLRACSPAWRFSILLVYLLIVVNFQSWLDPFIIITALPAALAGIVLFLFFTGTTLSVPALMGAIMCMGVATANSILMVSFAASAWHEHGDAIGCDRSRLHAVPPGADDGARDDHRHAADGAWTWRGRRAERAAWTRRDRRPAVGYRRDVGFRSGRLLPTAPKRGGAAPPGPASDLALQSSSMRS